MPKGYNDSHLLGAKRRQERQHHVRAQNARRLDEYERRYRASVRSWARTLVRDAIAKGVIDDSNGKRLDTNTALFTRSLAEVLARPFDRRLPALKAISLLPPGEPLDPGAETAIARGHEMHGEATVTTTYQTEINRVTLQGSEHVHQIVGVIAQWFMGYQQVRAAAMSGVPLNAKGLATVRRAVEQKIDDVLSLGWANAGISGLIDAGGATSRWQGGVNPVGNPTTGNWALAATTAQNIIDDIAKMVTQVESGELYTPTDLVVAPDEWNRINTLPVGIVANMTVMQWIKMSWGFTVSRWNRLDLIPATMTVSGAQQNRALLYEKSAEVVEPLVSVDLEYLPAVWTGLGWETNVHARTGGVHCENPLGFLAFDMA